MISPDFLDNPVEGDITGISFYSGDSDYLNGTYLNNAFLLCYTSLTELTISFSDNYDSNDPVTVFKAPEMELNWTRDDWQEPIILDPAWHYDGASNYILEIVYKGVGAGDSNYTRSWMSPTGKQVIDMSDAAAEYGSYLSFSNWLRFEITPGSGIESASLGQIKAIYR